MKTLRKILWVILVTIPGLIVSIMMGITFFATVVFFLLGIQAFQFTKLIVKPEGKTVSIHYGKHPIWNTLWILLGGFVMIITFYVLAGILYITVIGIPLAKQLANLAKFTLAPFGAEIYQDGQLVVDEEVKADANAPISRTLDKKWKEIVYAASGLGPNLLMVLMMAYYTDAINPVALGEGSLEIFSINGSTLIVVGIWGALWFFGRVFDGLIDIPLAHVTDSMRSKLGRHRTPIAIAFLPMVVGFVMCWIPVGGANQVINTIWMFFWSLVFFAAYTMCLITLYGSFSKVCTSERQRTRVSSYKSVFDTLGYCLVYALVPLLLNLMNLSLDKFVFILVPLMFTMLIPLFMVKEGAKYETPEELAKDEEAKVSLWTSLKLTFTNKPFLKWLAVNCCAFFGLQLFLASMNTLITGVMGLSGAQMAILNTCAFAPVPLMIFLFYKFKNKIGIRTAYQTCLIAFGLGLLSFVIGSEWLFPTNVTARIVIGCIGGVCASWSIGVFFMTPYLIPSQIAAAETKLTGKNHSAMYFAVQAVVTSIVGAVSSGLIYEYIKQWTTPKIINGVQQYTEIGGELVPETWKCGVTLVPVITAGFCLIGFFLCFLMPKKYTTEVIAKEMGIEYNPEVDGETKINTEAVKAN